MADGVGSILNSVSSNEREKQWLTCWLLKLMLSSDGHSFYSHFIEQGEIMWLSLSSPGEMYNSPAQRSTLRRNSEYEWK